MATASISVDHIRRPHLWLTLAEPWRAMFEATSLFLQVGSLAAAPKGDGSTVMVLPGFATADPMTKVLRTYLAFLGYDSAPWGLGLNTGYQKFVEDPGHLRQRLEDLYARSGRKVALVGWSLGGIQSRMLAHEHPEMVRQVIMVGSPFSGNPDAVVIKRLYELVSGEDLKSDEAQKRFERDRRPIAGIRTTAIYSETDGITAWENCIEPAGAETHNVEVGGSHLGLTHNAAAFLAIAHALHGAGKTHDRGDPQ